jgi:hypothetical protein
MHLANHRFLQEIGNSKVVPGFLDIDPATRRGHTAEQDDQKFW